MLFYLLLISSAAAALGDNSRVCPLNEEPGNRCRTPDIDCTGKPIVIVPDNVTSCDDCVCKRDYFRTPFGECVTRQQCDQCDAAKLEAYQSCGTSCPLVCNQTIDSICFYSCTEGCFCLPGYIRTSPTGTCVPINDCPPLCSNFNHEFSTCIPTCPEVCNRTITSPPCGPCINSGCRCKSGFLIDPVQFNECVPEDVCVSP